MRTPLLTNVHFCISFCTCAHASTEYGLSANHVMKDTTGIVSNRIHLGVSNHLERTTSFSFKISITLSSFIYTMLVKHTVSLHEFYVR